MSPAIETAPPDGDPAESGKWDFTDDYERRRAITEEAEAKYGWITHVAMAAVVAAVLIALAVFRSPIISRHSGCEAPATTTNGI